ncbi:MAG: SRPBCC family protein [Betaproteobacteria bacterium]
MKWLIRIVVGLVFVVAAFVAIGWLLPAEFKVQRSAQIAAPADKVYVLIADPREWKRWGVWSRRDPAMKMDYSGAASGAGARWSWQSESEGNGVMEFTAAKPNERIAYTLTFPDMGMQSRGVLEITPAGPGVVVTWTNEGNMGSNPINRWFGLFMDKLVGPDFAAGLDNLKQIAEGK